MNKSTKVKKMNRILKHPLSAIHFGAMNVMLPFW